MLINQAHKASWGRFVLSLLVLAWASASAQPCLMAMEMAKEQPAMEEHAGHEGHGGVEHECNHCPPDGGCATISRADCNSLPEFNIESRHLELKLKSVFNAALPAGFGQVLFEPEFHPPPPLRDVRSLRHDTEPSLSVLYCVYLK